MTNGWIKLHRKFLDWEWYGDGYTKDVFLDLLLMANHKPTRFRGYEIEIGQTIFGRKACAKRLRISEQNVRTAINHLKSTTEITTKVTNKFSIITLLNYTKYQIVPTKTNQQDNQEANQRLTNNQPTTNHTQECKKNKNIKKDTKVSTAKAEYGNPNINKILLALKETIGIEAFVDSSIERMMAKHCLSLIGKIGKEEFKLRLEGLLTEQFHAKNCNKIKYVYNNIKGWKKPTSNCVFIS